MKKKLIFAVAVFGLLFCSCSKNPAEDYEGTYSVEAKGEYTFSQVKASGNFGTDEKGTMTIRRNGDNGNVVIEGNVFNTTGYVDDDGVLHMNNETHIAEGSGLSLLNYSLLNCDANTRLTHSAITLKDGKMSWTSSGIGMCTLSSLDLVSFDMNTSVLYTNAAVSISNDKK